MYSYKTHSPYPPNLAMIAVQTIVKLQQYVQFDNDSMVRNPPQG